MPMQNSDTFGLGSDLPAMRLEDPAGDVVDVGALAGGRPVLVMFLCNHCPYVRHLAGVLGERTREWMDLGLTVVGINSNDPMEHPADRADRMPGFAADHGWCFPYLVDTDQHVARDLDAVCTPDLFLFDRSHRLAYHGRFDASRPGTDTVPTGEDLDRAVRLVLVGERVPADGQFPCLGCSIKWRDDGPQP